MERNCNNCRHKKALQGWDFNRDTDEMNVVHTQLEGYACLGFSHEGVAVWITGSRGVDQCEMWMANDSQIKECSNCKGSGACDGKKSEDSQVKALQEFALWVTDWIFKDDFEESAGAFAELACRRLYKLGYVFKEGENWLSVDYKEIGE